MERRQVRAEAALQALLDLQAALSTRPYLLMLEFGIITREQAAFAIRDTATWVEQETSAEPFVGYAIAQGLRTCADAMDHKPSLQLIEGGRSD
jgi:hypothetical protein